MSEALELKIEPKKEAQEKMSEFKYLPLSDVNLIQITFVLVNY